MIYTGFRISQYYKKRCTLLEYTLMLLKRLEIDFRYSSSNVYDAFNKYSEELGNGNISYLKKCLGYIDSGYDFPVAFCKSVEEERLFTDDEKSKLILFGNSLGTSSVDTQLSLIGYYTELFEKFYDDSRSKSDKNSKTAFLMCAFIGFGFYIISI